MSETYQDMTDKEVQNKKLLRFSWCVLCLQVKKRGEFHNRQNTLYMPVKYCLTAVRWLLDIDKGEFLFYMKVYQ